MITSNTVAPGSASAILLHSPQMTMAQSICFDTPYVPKTESAVLTTITIVRTLPQPKDGSFSFSDMLSVLGDTGMAAFNHHRSVLDHQLRERYLAGEISSIHYYRCLARMTQEQLADRTHSRQSFISQLETRKRPLTWKQARRFAVPLGVMPQQLMERE